MEVLPKDKYDLALAALDSVPFNTLFAKGVLQTLTPGIVYTDSAAEPNCYYVVTDYGMTLLFGSPSDRFLETGFKSYIRGQCGRRTNKQWMQIHPLSLESKIDQLLNAVDVDTGANTGDTTAIVRHQRVNFRFNQSTFDAQSAKPSAPDFTISPLSAKTYQQFGEQVTPRIFWESHEKFVRHGQGYELKEGQRLLAVSFSAFPVDTELELGMEVTSDARKRGLGALVTSKLIRYCIDNQLTPIWSCNYSNKGSYHLAQKLGFEPILKMPYYEIPLWWQ